MSGNVNQRVPVDNDIFKQSSDGFEVFVVDVFGRAHIFPVARIKATKDGQWDIQALAQIRQRKNVLFERKVSAIFTERKNRKMSGNQYVLVDAFFDNIL